MSDFISTAFQNRHQKALPSGLVTSSPSPNSPTSDPDLPASGPNSPGFAPSSLASGTKSKSSPVPLKVVIEDEDSEGSDDTDAVYDYPDPSKEDLRFPPVQRELSFDNAVPVKKKKDEELGAPQSSNKTPRNPTYRNLPIYPINPKKGNSLDRRKESNITQESARVSATHTLTPSLKPLQSAPRVQHQAVKPVQSVKPQPSSLPTVVKPESTTVPSTPQAKKPVAPITAPRPRRTNSKTTGPKFSYSQEEIMEMSVLDVFETMKKLGLGDKADKFKENRVDGSFLVSEMTDAALAEFSLTEVESLHVKRFMKEGKLPKMN